MAEKMLTPAEVQAMIDAAVAAALAKTTDAGTAAVRVLAERSAPAENPNYNEVSPYTYPEGERVRPKPHLTRATFFGGVRQREDDLTPLEIEAFNALTASRSARNGRWTAEVRRNGLAEELYVEFPQRTIDERFDLPPCSMLLLELAQGKRAADPVALAERVAELERLFAEQG